MTKPCHRKWSNVIPNRSTHGSEARICIAFMIRSLSLWQRFQHAADIIQFFACGRLRRQGAHHQTSGRTAEGPFQ